MAPYGPPGAASSWRYDGGCTPRAVRRNTPQNRQPDAAGLSVATVHADGTLKSPLLARRSWCDTWRPQHITATFRRQGAQSFRPREGHTRSSPLGLRWARHGRRQPSGVNRKKRHFHTQSVRGRRVSVTKVSCSAPSPQ